MGQIDHYMNEHGLDGVLPSIVRTDFTLARFEAGETICKQGDAAGQLHFLVKGKIRVSHTSATGKRLVLSFKYPLDLIGDIEYVRRSPFLNTVEAVTPVEISSCALMTLTGTPRTM